MRLVRIAAWVIIVIAAFIGCVPMPARAQTVRVGWYLIEGLQEYDASSGQYGGYNYEYLRTIAQYTGWDYEFVILPFSECMQQLETGELDIVGNLAKLPERETSFLYPVNNEGHAGPRLMTTIENVRYGYEDVSAFNGMRLGMYGASNLVQVMNRYGAAHHISWQPVYYQNQVDMISALHAGKIDAILASGTQRIPGMRVLAQLPQQDIYFVTTKGKEWVRRGLDQALSQIKFYNPNYDENLYSKYFSDKGNYIVAFTNEEQEYLARRIATGEAVLVAYDPAWIPAEYRNPDTGSLAGVMKGIFDLIGQRTGLQFKYVAADSYDTTTRQYLNQVEVYSTISYDYNWGDRFNAYLTQPIFDVQIFMVHTGDPNQFNRIAVPKGYHLTKEIMRRYKETDSSVEFVYYDTMADCIDAVINHDVGRTYINEYELNYYMDKLSRQQLNIQAVPGFTEPTSIGVSKNADPLLLSIIARSLRSIPPSEINDIIMNNTHRTVSLGLEDWIYANPFKAIGVASVFFLFVAGTLFFAYSSWQNRRQRQMFERANNAKSDFLSRISHDIRTPMNAIIGMTELAGMENRSASVADYLNKINVSSKFLLSLINDILDMAMIDKGKIVLHPEAYSLSEFSVFITSAIMPLAEAKQIHFTFDVDQDLQGIRVDPLRFNQIFMNLLSNAVKFTPEGGTVTFSLTVMGREGNDVHLCGIVKDTGIGIAPKFLDSLFEPFTQENEQHVQMTEGSGLGLAIVKRFVDALGGTITVDSVKGKGTIFTVKMILEACDVQLEVPGREILDMADLKGKQVLVVEDNEINQVIVCQLLEHYGVHCHIAANGQEALDMFTAAAPNTYDVILMDIRMPVMDGIEATYRLRHLDRADGAAIPIIALTADAYVDQRTKIMESGMTDYLAKPVQPQALLDILHKVLQNKK
jgi:two-component system sensor histidine kinase EvgS